MSEQNEPTPTPAALPIAVDSELIFLVGTGYNARLKGTAIEQKKALLERAHAIEAVNTEADVQTVRALLRDLTKFRTTLDTARKAVKAPAIEFGKKIDAKSAEFGQPCLSAEQYLTKLVEAFAREQERQRQEAAEAARYEAEAAARKAAEAARAAEDLARKQRAEAEAATMRERQAQQAALIQAQREAAAAEASAKAAQEATLFAAPAIVGVKPVLDFEVEDLHKLYSIAPGLVELSPRRALILGELNRQRDSGHHVGLPGLRVVEKMRVTK